ncbi:MAG: hypothetical protein QM296_10050 [Bacillota bacterium]|nr:hypothetical protein [Bacillota bacterium]
MPTGREEKLQAGFWWSKQREMANMIAISAYLDHEEPVSGQNSVEWQIRLPFQPILTTKSLILVKTAWNVKSDCHFSPS